VHLSNNSTVDMVNNIVVSQTVGITNPTPANSTVSADHTLFDGNGLNYGGGVSSTNEIPGPAALKINFHLQSGSNAIGNALPLSWITRDIDNDPRPIGLPDVGADEYVAAHLWLPLVLRQ
jgi:hypothetical protein